MLKSTPVGFKITSTKRMSSFPEQLSGDSLAVLGDALETTDVKDYLLLSLEQSQGQRFI